MLKVSTLIGVCLFSGILHAQEHDISPLRELNSTQLDICLAMLPDSSMLISSYREGQCRAYHMVWKDKTWVKTDSRLADMINALMPRADSEPHFRFSPDFTHIVVTIQENGPHRYFESELVNNEWSLFSPIEINQELNVWHGIAMTADYSTLYGRTKNGAIYQFNRTGGSWSKGERFTAFDLISPGDEWVEDVLTIGSNALLANVSYQASRDEAKAFGKKYEPSRNKKRAYFMVKKQTNGKWTAPIVLQDVHPLADNLVPTPAGNWMLFIGGGDFGKMPMPKFVRAEIASARSASAVAAPVVASGAEQTRLAENTSMSDGKFYALLIGNADYKIDKLDLDKPTKDVQVLSKTLQAYHFEEQNIVQLYNADRNAIFSSLAELRKKTTRRDNVLIFYAGHGSWDNVVKQGYWWPVDASPDNAANWISNSDLKEQISGINSAHTLLISDACFSGAIFKERSVEELRTASFDTQQLYRLRSRRALTSGTLQAVPDESPFIRYLVQFLNDNPDKFLSSGELFGRMRKSVLNNSMTVPQEGVIMNTGDEGGDFIFIRK